MFYSKLAPFLNGVAGIFLSTYYVPAPFFFPLESMVGRFGPKVTLVVRSRLV